MNDPGRHLSDAELEEQARIMPADIERAKASAQRHGSERFNALLNATVVPEAPAEVPSKRCHKTRATRGR